MVPAVVYFHLAKVKNDPKTGVFAPSWLWSPNPTTHQPQSKKKNTVHPPTRRILPQPATPTPRHPKTQTRRTRGTGGSPAGSPSMGFRFPSTGYPDFPAPIPPPGRTRNLYCKSWWGMKLVCNSYRGTRIAFP
jgi:hypothetical protein